jgi:hypothetical protein
MPPNRIIYQKIQQVVKVKRSPKFF